jgi:myo-inositol 2-dehydrogenase / D-chiro-inositol 1-dehydrogenase
MTGMKATLSRRAFLRSTAATAVFSIVPRHVLGGPGYTPPSERLTKAIIGVGGMGLEHLGLGDAKLLAVCDVDDVHLKRAVERGGADVKGYKDFREVLARPDIDIVHIPTPPHWHALISIAAAEAGKDVWCEKPMARTIGESRRVREAVQRHGRIFRLNTWFRFQSDLYGIGKPVQPIKKAVMNGLLGWPLKVTVGAHQGFDWKLGMWQGRPQLAPEPVPDRLDYDFWLGPAPFKPYNAHRTHGTFRGYWDYDGGGLGDMGMHYLDPVQYLLDKDDTSPAEIEADSPLQHPDAALPWRRVRMKYADGCEIILDGDNTLNQAPFIEGPEGWISKGFTSSIADLERKLRELPDPPPQQTDFEDSVRRRKTFALNESNGHRSCSLVNLAICAVRLGRPLRYDPVAERFVNDDAANRLIDQPMRAPWRI